MFFHNVKYYTLDTIRQKPVVFWLMMFPIILSTFFHAAFSGIYEKDFLNNAIPVAVVVKRDNPNFKKVMDELSKGEDKMFDTTWTDEEQALKLLEDGDVIGVIYVDPALSLSVRTDGLDQTIIKTFLDRYSVTESVIIENAIKNPSSINDVSAAFSQELNAVRAQKLSDGNMDVYVTYMYNLIAMVCVLGSTVGLSIALNNEANLSSVGMRTALSPTSKLQKCFAGLVSGCIVQTFCSLIASIYIVFVLKEDLGVPFGMVTLVAVVGSWLGVSIGFFFGSVGRLSISARTGICTSVTMFCCFLSGLMLGDMKMTVEENAPIINRINPPALISDALYVLNVDDNLDRFIVKMITMLSMTVGFTVLGFIVTRRKKYASL